MYVFLETLMLSKKYTNFSQTVILKYKQIETNRNYNNNSSIYNTELQFLKLNMSTWANRKRSTIVQKKWHNWVDDRSMASDRLPTMECPSYWDR